MMRRVLAFLPVAAVCILGGFFAWGLLSGRDPSAIPSVLISQPVPQFDLPPVEGVAVPGLGRSDLLETSEMVVVNMFASWCLPCRAEHGVLTRLARDRGFTLMGINYKDKPADATAWLAELGNPYSRIGADGTGRAGIEWGISGVPETFIIDATGTIRHRFVGPVVGDGERRFLEALDAL